MASFIWCSCPSFLHWFYFMHTSAGAQRVQKTVSGAQELVRSGREPPRIGARNGTQTLYKWVLNHWATSQPHVLLFKGWVCVTFFFFLAIYQLLDTSLGVLVCSSDGVVRLNQSNLKRRKGVFFSSHNPITAHHWGSQAGTQAEIGARTMEDSHLQSGFL